MSITRIVLALCFGVGMTSCSPRLGDIVIGKWEQFSGPPPSRLKEVQTRVLFGQAIGSGLMTFDFRPDGIVITQGGGAVSGSTSDGKIETQGGSQPLTNHYTFVDKSTLKIAFSKGLRFQGREAMFKVSGSRNQLVLTQTMNTGVNLSSENGVFTLRRIK